MKKINVITIETVKHYALTKMTVYEKVCLTLTNFLQFSPHSVSIEYDDGCCSGVVFKNMWSKKLNTTLVLFKIDEVRTKFHISQEVNEKVTSSLMLPISSMKLFIAMILEILIQLHFIRAGNADNGMDYDQKYDIKNRAQIKY